MQHYKVIRRGHKGRNVKPATKSLLYNLRLQEADLERRFEDVIKIARTQNRCTALIMPTIPVSTQYHTIPAREGSVCGEPASKLGFCRKHFFSHVLYVRDRERAGRGVTRRPFAAYRLPVSQMSDIQFDLMADLERLPMDTPYEGCIERLNSVDPSHSLEPIPVRTSRKLQRVKSTS